MFVPNQSYHIFNQGNNKQDIFFNDENYYFFIRKMRQHLLPYVDIIAYCLMPNHFHWLVHTKEEACQLSKVLKPGILQEGTNQTFSIQSNQQILSYSIAILLRSYTRAINIQEGRTGSLFRSKTKMKDGIIDGFITVTGKNSNLFFSSSNDYEKVLFDYIHNNPVKAGLVKNAIDWKFSSSMDYAGLRKGTLCNKLKAKSLDLLL